MAVVVKFSTDIVRDAAVNGHWTIPVAGWWYIEGDAPFKLQIIRPSKPGSCFAVGFSDGSAGVLCGVTSDFPPDVGFAYMQGTGHPAVEYGNQPEYPLVGAHVQMYLERGDEIVCSQCTSGDSLTEIAIAYLGEHEVHVGFNSQYHGPVTQAAPF